MIKAEFYSGEEKNGKVRCLLCPRLCLIGDRFTGACLVRTNVNGVLYSKAYFQAAAVNADPVEKKPLYHFYPGSTALSVGAAGCNMSCGFCQNFHISQNMSSEIPVSAEELITIARETGSTCMAYTYTEPTVWYEFTSEMAIQAKSAGLKNIFVTNGNINPKPLEQILPLVDAANIDIKTFSGELYEKIGGNFETVKNTINVLYHTGIHTEISSLIVPDLWNDELFEEMCFWLGETNRFTPLHINRYFPAYKYRLPATPEETLIRFKNIADKYLKYVYIGNARIAGASDTLCHKCGEPLIKRRGYETEILISEPKCPKCSANIPLVL